MQYTNEREHESIRSLARIWLEQSRRHVRAGQVELSRALLVKVWTITEHHATDLANWAAWEMAWLLLREELYAEAAEWFDRVVTLPAEESVLWSEARQSQVQLCHDMARMAAARAANTGPVFAASKEPGEPSRDLALLKITTMGCFKIARGGHELPRCTIRKAIGLFRYLLTLRHREASKDVLMELFWPGIPARKAAHNLHVAISTLRQYLDRSDQSYVLYQAGTYLINPEAMIEEDRHNFLQLSDVADQHWHAGDIDLADSLYGQAMTHYKGDYFIDDLDLTWAIVEQEQLLSRYLLVLERLSQLAFRQQQFGRAIDYAQRLLERDEYREDVYGLLMQCYGKLGRRGDVMRQYERCRSILARDLGVEPMPETQALFTAALSGE